MTVGRARQPIHDLASVSTREHRDETEEHARAADVVDVRVRTLQCRPDARPAWMNVANDRQAGLRLEGAPGGDAIPARAVGLPEIHYDHRDVAASSHELPRQ